MGEDELKDAFDRVVAELQILVMPVLGALARGEKPTRQWRAGKGWVAES